MTLCQLIKAIDDFNGKFGIGGVGDVFIGVEGFNLIFRDLCINRNNQSERFSNCLSKSKPTINLMGFEGLPLS
jgi:hypothetical protein